MLIEAIGQVHSISSDPSNFKISVVKRQSCIDSYYAFTFNYGSYYIYLYQILCPIPEESPKHDEMEEDSVHQARWACKLTHTMTFRLDFPVCCVVPADDKIWAIGNDTRVDLRRLLYEQSLKHRASHYLSCQNYVSKGEASTKEEKKTIKRNPLVFVHPCIDNSLLTCRSDIYHRAWSIQLVMENETSIPLSQVPFPSDILLQLFSKMKALGTEDLDLKSEIVLTCIQAEGVLKHTINSLLSQRSFASFFGVEALHQSNAVILCGLPTGLVLWHSFFFQCEVKAHQSLFQFKVLCDIQQPVIGIHTFNGKSNTTGNDNLLIIGAFGKVVLLSDSVNNNARQNSFDLTISYIPSPVFLHNVVKNKIYHTSSDGQLWISEYNEHAVGKEMFKSQSSNIHKVISISQLVDQKEIFVFATLEGTLYLGYLEHVRDEDYDAEVDSLFAACTEQNEQMISLQLTKKKQKALFVQLASAITFNLKHAIKNGISCSVNQLPDKELQLQISCKALQSLHINPELCSLNICVSRNHCHNGVSLSKTLRLCRNTKDVVMKIPPSFYHFYSGSPFPWIIKISLILTIDKEMKQMNAFKSFLLKFPCHIYLKTLLVHSFSLLRDPEDSQTGIRGTRKLDVNSSILKLLEKNNIRQYTQNQAPIQNVEYIKSFTFRLTATTAQSFSKEKGEEMCMDVLRYLINQNIKGYPERQMFTNLGSPFNISVEAKENFFYINISAESFKMFVDARFSIVHLLLQKSPLVCGTTTQRVTVFFDFLEKLEEISRKISLSINSEDVENCSKLYNFLRNEITSKLYF